MNNFCEGYLKISELSKATGVSVSTLKFYVKEGLIQIAYRSGKNMGYYTPDTVEKIRMIKALQAEKYYPLSVIKRIVNSADSNEELLLEAINKADDSEYYHQITLAEAIKKWGLSKEEANSLIEAKLMTVTKTGKASYCNQGDMRMMSLVKHRIDVGMPIEQTISAFFAYQSALEASCKTDVDGLVQSLLTKPMETKDMQRLITTSDETHDDFITMKR